MSATPGGGTDDAAVLRDHVLMRVDEDYLRERPAAEGGALPL